MKNPKEVLGDACGIPKDISLNLPHIEIIANKEVYIDNYQSLISYDNDKIIIGKRGFKINISGKNLEIKSIRRDDMLILGEILHIEYEI